MHMYCRSGWEHWSAGGCGRKPRSEGTGGVVRALAGICWCTNFIFLLSRFLVYMVELVFVSVSVWLSKYMIVI